MTTPETKDVGTQLTKALAEMTLDKKQTRDLLILAKRADLTADARPGDEARRLRTFSSSLSALVRASREGRSGVVPEVLRLFDEMLRGKIPVSEVPREVVHPSPRAAASEHARTRRSLPGREPGADGAPPRR